MKHKNLFLVVFGGFCILLIFSCEGPIGPSGPAGADGTDGVDGNVVCLQCHSLSYRTDIEAQYAMTRHGNSALQYNGLTTVQYAGGRKSCARCHSHEGFVETQFTGMDTTAYDISIPTQIGCTTCHDTHISFDFETDGQDYALRTTDPIELIASDGQIDFKGSSNLCGTCHQARKPAPVDDGEGNFNITSPYYGPHHAPSATVLYGIGGYEVAGAETYPTPGSSAHASSSSCVNCHMYSFENNQGGHSLVPNENACLDCHSSGIPSIEAEITALLDELEILLKTEGVLDENGRVVKGKFPVDVAGAFFNYALVEEDLSGGIHNPEYTKALLKNSISSLQ